MRKQFLFLSFITGIGLQAQQPAYLDTSLGFEQRVEDLVSRMTLEEKVSQMRYDAPAIERLGIPAYNWWNEALHGVARSGLATVFPQAIGLAATWDRDVMFRVATAISDEARAKYHDYLRRDKHGIYQGLTFWSPNINIFRDPRWGRGMETYGEDPLLTGSLAVEFIRGMQGDHPRYLKAIATAKHFAVHSGPEPARHEFDAVISNTDLYGTYLPAFRMSVREGNVQSVMCAYNRFLGDPCCGSSLLLRQILRDRWGFNGYVVSDCWAIMDFYNTHRVVKTQEEAAAMALGAGTDLNCGVSYRSLVKSIELGLAKESDVDAAVERLFLARMKLGMFDPPDMNPYSGIPLSRLDCDDHRKLALETASKSVVLLKNASGTLPLSKNIASLAVIGPNADDAEVLMGNYNGTPSRPVTPLQGIMEKIPATEIHYAAGCAHAEGLPIFETIPPENLFRDAGHTLTGLRAELYRNAGWKGEPVHERVDTTVDFNWWNDAPYPDLDPDDFSIRWTGYIVPGHSGRYAIGAEGVNGFNLYLGDSLVCKFNSVHETWKRYVVRELEAGHAYPVTLSFFNYQGYASVRLIWSYLDSDYRREALEATAAADAVVMFLGLSPRLEGEEMDVSVEGFTGGDRSSLDLPGIQQELLEEVSAMGKPVVLVLLNGSALAVNWAQDNIPAILEAWYPGQAAGTAIADVLFGDFNPCGRLPVTFYRSVDQLPPFTDYRMAGRTYRFFEGNPLYPFGFGLSYTTFEYSGLRLDPVVVNPGDFLTISVSVKNTGRMPGEEVVQIYADCPEAPFQVPIIELKDYAKVRLAEGEEKEVVFSIPSDRFLQPDENGEMILVPGTYKLSASGSLPVPRSLELGAPPAVTATFSVPDK